MSTLCLRGKDFVMPRRARGIFLRIVKIINFRYNKDYKSLRARCIFAGAA